MTPAQTNLILAALGVAFIAGILLGLALAGLLDACPAVPRITRLFTGMI